MELKVVKYRNIVVLNINTIKQLLILLICVILFSCSNENKRYHIDETTTPSDTITYLKSDMKPLNGIVFCEFGENGKYINGKKEGLHKEWYKSGQIQSELEYENGKINFKKHIKYWYEDGQLMIEDMYVKKQNIGKMYYGDGKLRHKIISEDGKIISKQCWDYDGNEIKCENDDVVKWN